MDAVGAPTVGGDSVAVRRPSGGSGVSRPTWEKKPKSAQRRKGCCWWCVAWSAGGEREKNPAAGRETPNPPGQFSVETLRNPAGRPSGGRRRARSVDGGGVDRRLECKVVAWCAGEVAEVATGRETPDPDCVVEC